MAANRKNPAAGPLQKQPGTVRGRPFEKGKSGNPAGKRPGTKARATLAAEQLLDGEAEAITRKAIDLALAGDTTALRLVLDRIVAPRKDRPVRFALPPMKTADDAASAMAAVAAAVAAGDLTPTEAASLANVVETFRRTLETTDLARRVAELESRS